MSKTFESKSVRNANASNMGKKSRKKKVAFLACVSLGSLGLLGNFPITTVHAAVAPHVVISEIYGGGGNSGASYTNDYIELYNPTSSTVNLSGWSVQYASASGSFSYITNLSGSIGPDKYYLIQEAAGTGGTVNLPTPDATGTTNLSATSGKVALAKVTTAVSGSSDSNVVDFVGYGTANDSETSPIGALSNTTGAERKDNNGGNVEGQGNGWDTDDNATDLVVTSTLDPNNSSSPAEPSSGSGGTGGGGTGGGGTGGGTGGTGGTGGGTDNDNIGLGNPTGATTDTSYPDNYLMVKPQYDLSYNNTKHEANWVSWHLDATNLGSTPRQNDFRADTSLPSGWYEVQADEYTSSGFDRGHMCPSGDRTDTVANNSETFLMTNMLPQAPNLNRYTWEELEAYSRTLVNAGDELYIISGGYGQGGTGSSGYMTTVGNGVVVPAYTWKIVVVLPNGDNDISRISTTTRVIAVMMPNTETVNSQPWGNYRVSVNSIEADTGYDFLSAVPANIQSVLKAEVDNGPTS